MIFLNKEKYTSLELGILIFFLLNSFTSTILINSFKNMSSLTITVSILISFLIGFILLKVFSSLFTDCFLENLSKSKIFKNVIKMIFMIGGISIAVYSIFNLSLVIKDIILPNMSQKIIELTFLILASILALKGMKSISIAASLMFLVYVIVVIINSSFNLFNVVTINLLPISIDFDKVNFYQLLILSIAPIFMLLIIPKKEIMNFKGFKKYSYLFYIIFYIYFIVKILFIISILGEKYFSIMNYPYIEVLKMINIFNFFERLEEILIINIFIENLIVLAVSLNYLSSIVNSIYNIDKKAYILIDIIIFLFLIKLDVVSNSLLTIILTIFVLANIITYKRKYRE